MMPCDSILVRSGGVPRPRPFALFLFVAGALLLGIAGSSVATQIRPDGLLQVDNKVLFPIGLVDLGAFKYPDWNGRIRDARVNIVWDVESAYADTIPTCAAVLDSAQAAGYYILAGSGDTWLWDDMATPELEVDQHMYEPDELDALVDCMSGSTRVIGFANRDEPAWVISRGMVGDIDSAHVHDTFGQLHARVPDTVVALNHAPTHLSGEFSQWKESVLAFREASDITMFACYPYPAGPGTCGQYNVLGYPDCKMDRLAVGADLFRLEINRPGQPLWMILQAHKNIPLREARWEAYASIIHGAKGIFWAGWVWTHALGGGEENWPVIRQVISEIADFHPFLVRNDVSGISTTNPDLEAAGKRLQNGNTVVFAISRNGFAGEGAIYLPGAKNGKVHLPHENGRSMYANDGWITDYFEPYEGHAYHYNLSTALDDAVDAATFDITPARFELRTSPNPTAGPARARFALPAESTVLLAVYDAAGRRVAVVGSGTFDAGTHELSWNGRDAAGHEVAPGLYFVRATTTRGETATAKVIVRR